MSLFGSKITLQLDVDGMTCGNCVEHVTRALQGVPGVIKVEVSLEDNKAVVTAGERVEAGLLVAAVQQAGYGATPA